MLNKKGLTLIEIIVATLIMALVMTGLANIFVAGKRHILHSRSRMTGGELGKFFLDPLQAHVRQDTWNQAGNALRAGTTYCDNNATHTQNPVCPPTPQDRTLDRIEYTAQYNITNHPQAANIRRVTLTVRWNEPLP